MKFTNNKIATLVASCVLCGTLMSNAWANTAAPDATNQAANAVTNNAASSVAPAMQSADNAANLAANAVIGQANNSGAVNNAAYYETQYYGGGPSGFEGNNQPTFLQRHFNYHGDWGDFAEDVFDEIFD